MRRIILVISLAWSCTLPAAERPGERRLVRIFIDQPHQAALLREQPLDWASSRIDRYADAIVSAAELSQLHSTGFRTGILHTQASLHQLARGMDQNMGAYHTWQEISDELAATAQTWPHITRLHSIGRSIEGRDIWAIKISDHPDLEEDDEPGILYTGTIHAREIITPEIIMDFLQLLTTGYGSDERITRLVDNRQIWLVPMINPDGHVRVELGDWFWRKNRRLNPDSSRGVDLNRNFGYKWGYDTIGSSSRTTSETYRGTGPFSEPETQALRALVENHKFVAALNYHSYGRMLLIPWGYILSDTPHHEIFMEMGRHMTRENGYVLGNARMGVIYRTNGDSDDYLYQADNNKGMIFSFTPEVGTTFLPPESEISTLIAEVRPANFYLAEAAGLLHGDPWRILRPPALALAASAADDDGIFTLSWNQPRADPNTPVAFDVEELFRYRSAIDDAESPALVWDLQRFVRTSSRAFSGGYSYGAALEENNIATMTTRFSITPAPGQVLRFRAWYDMEQYRDYAYMRVSQDQGASFKPINGSLSSPANPYGVNEGFGITGASAGWVDGSFDLSSFAGIPILIQFLYKTDALFQGEGFFVDDIGLVTMADEVVRIASSTAGVNQTLRKDRPGAYAFRVRGIDADGQFSDWSATAEVGIDWGRRGDLVRDGLLQGDDVDRFVALLAGTGPAPTAGEWYRADYDSLDDGAIRMSDLVRLQRALRPDSGAAAPSPGTQILHFEDAGGSPGDALVSRLTLHLTRAAAGLQFVPKFSNDALILDSIRVAAGRDGWTVSEFRGASWVYSPRGVLLDSGATALLDIHFHIRPDAGIDIAHVLAQEILLCSASGEPMNVVADSARVRIRQLYTGVAAGQRPLQYGCVRNYPNPFNGETTLVFDLPAASWVQMEIFALNGTRVHSERRAPHDGGIAAWKIDAADWPSGLYLVRLCAGESVAQGKILLLR